ncbi:glycosyltransferase [Ningiella sp. W23]|uniref:glycosyltransferase n=1 Tax=Ningiella sp. W23 TaxID=3023715 RepID=UPI003756DB8E
MQDSLDKNLVVLFIGFIWPETNATAAGQNIVSYVRTLLDAGYKVHFASAAQQGSMSTDLTLLDSKPGQIQCHQIKLNCDSFNQFVAELDVNIVIFDRFLTEEQFGWRVMKAAPHAMRVLDCEDLHFLRHARHQLYKAQGYSPSSAEYLRPNSILDESSREFLYSELCAREMACIFRCDLTLTLSNFEASLLVEHFNLSECIIHQVGYISHDIDDESKRSASQHNASHDFISIGNFRHAPNIDAVRILVRKIWPGIRESLPDADLHIYGAYMPPKIKGLNAPKKGIHMHGHAPCQFEVLSKAKVMLAPIQFGAGVKGKLRDAILCKLPSITTPIGAEGIEYERWPGAVVSTEQDFIDKAIEAYSMGRASFEDLCMEVEKHNFDKQSNAQKLVDSLERSYRNLQNRRSNNFMQIMLSHHSLQTHKYMSQWIEAKNA